MIANLTSFDESERADYLSVLASMAGADGKLTSHEILALRQLCELFVLGPTARGRVITATTANHELEQLLEAFSHSPLRHSLILDLCLTALWDGVLDPAELDELANFGEKLKLSTEQIEAVLALAKDIAAGQKFDASLEHAIDTGVPRAGLAMSASLDLDQALLRK